jgi:hypothetical protein
VISWWSWVSNGPPESKSDSLERFNWFRVPDYQPRAKSNPLQENGPGGDASQGSTVLEGSGGTFQSLGQGSASGNFETDAPQLQAFDRGCAIGVAVGNRPDAADGRVTQSIAPAIRFVLKVVSAH